MWTISQLTIKEVISRRIFLITILMTIAFLALYGTAIYFAGKETPIEGSGLSQAQETLLIQKFISSQLLGVGLYFSSFITALLAILSSVSSISTEIANHQIDTWLMRPISRLEFVAGRFLGLTFLMVLYVIGLFFSIIFLHQTIGVEWMDLNIGFSQMLTAASVFMLYPVVLIGLGMLLSTKFTTLNAGIIAIILYGAAFIGGFIEQFGALAEKASLVNIGIVMSLILPVDSIYRKMTISLFDQPSSPLSFAQGGMFTSISAPSNAVIIYAILYGVIMVLMAFYSFKKRDV